MKEVVFTLIWIVCQLAFNATLWSQDSLNIKDSDHRSLNNTNTNRNAERSNSLKQLKKSIEQEDESATAINYEDLGDADFKNQNFQKAERYFRQALNLYSKQKNKSKISELNRKIARSQEAQNKNQEAAASYKAAEKTAVNTMDQQTNWNDANRIGNNMPIQEQRSVYKENADLYKSQGNAAAATEVYTDLAQAEIKSNNLQEARNTLEKAIATAPSEAQRTEIKQQLAEVLAKENKVNDAVAVSRKILQEAIDNQNTVLQIDQLIQLSSFYKTDKKIDSSVYYLNIAYTICVENYLTKDAKVITDSIANAWVYAGNIKNANEAYIRFNQDLDMLLSNDKSLKDENAMAATEQRIVELEKERELQAAVIKGKNNFNYALIGSLLLMLGLLGFIFRSWYAIKRKNKKIALQSLRREMNPHFIFNSLNSVNLFIAENDELAANKFLTSYSSLMRNIMEHSNHDFVKMSVEVDQLKKYLALEYLRFKDQFEYEIDIDDSIDEEMTYIPNMLLQPQLENAVWHGLRYLDHKGKLTLRFYKKEQQISAEIRDNGIGIAQSKAMKTQHQKIYQSIGISNTQQRIQLLNDLYKTNIQLQITSNDTGTIVNLDFGNIRQQVKKHKK